MSAQGTMQNQQKMASRRGVRWALGLLMALLVLCLFAGRVAAHSGLEDKPAHPFIISGVVLNSDAAVLVENFARVLGETAGHPLKVQFVNSYSLLSEALRKSPNAIGWTCGAPFVEDRIRDGQQLIGVPLFLGQPTYHSLVIIRRGRPEKSLLDFKGQVLAYSDHRSNSSYVVPAYQLKQAGFEMENFFRLLVHAGNHERSIEAVASGLADVAAVDEYVWVEYLKTHPDSGTVLQVIDRYGPFPFTPIVAGKGVSKKSIAEFQQALVSLRDKPEGKEILRAFGLDGFTKKTASFYLPIEKMMRELNEPLKDVAP